MNEYIRKEEALRVISDVLFETPPTGKEQIAVLKCSHSVRELPAADVVPEIHGNWRSSGVPGSMLCIAQDAVLIPGHILSDIALTAAREWMHRVISQNSKMLNAVEE